MRTSSVISIVLFTTLGLLPLAANPTSEGNTGYGARYLPQQQKAPTADSTTDDQLRARQGGERFGGIADPEKKQKTYDLVSSSTFLQIDGVFTILPKGAVIHAPSKLLAYIVESPVGKFQAWPDFLSANRGLITTLEVTMDQAAGKTPMDSEKLAQARKGNSLVVATCRGGLVSVNSAPLITPNSKPSS